VVSLLTFDGFLWKPVMYLELFEPKISMDRFANPSQREEERIAVQTRVSEQLVCQRFLREPVMNGKLFRIDSSNQLPNCRIEVISLVVFELRS
jgi:hypothetical protein